MASDPNLDPDGNFFNNYNNFKSGNLPEGEVSFLNYQNIQYLICYMQIAEV